MRPLRRGAPETRRELHRQLVKLELLAAGAIQVKQRQPGIDFVLVLAAFADEREQPLLGAVHIAVGKADGGFFHFGVLARFRL